jgi:predicted phage replisome organizer
MPDIKWIKFTTGMFDDEKIKFIESMPDRDSILIIWIKMLALSGKLNQRGYLIMTDNLPYDAQMLSNEFHRPLKITKKSLEIFEKLSFIHQENGKIFINNWEKHQNIDYLEKIREQNKVRKQRQREREKQIISRDRHSDVTEQKKIEKKIENKNPSSTTSDIKNYKNVFTTYEECVGLIRPEINDNILADLKEYPEEWIIEALKESAKYNKPSLAYAEKILERWKQEGKDSSKNKTTNNGHKPEYKGQPGNKPAGAFDGIE